MILSNINVVGFAESIPELRVVEDESNPVGQGRRIARPNEEGILSIFQKLVKVREIRCNHRNLYIARFDCRSRLVRFGGGEYNHI